MDIYLWKGDTGIGRRATLTDENGPVDLKDADVRFLFGSHEIIPVREDDGKLLIVFEKVHTKDARIFRAVFRVQFVDGRIETFPGPKESKILVKVKEW